MSHCGVVNIRKSKMLSFQDGKYIAQGVFWRVQAS